MIRTYEEFDNWIKQNKSERLGIYSSHPSKSDILLSKFASYLIPFISKRTRVKVKHYFKYRHLRKLTRKMINAINDTCANNTSFQKVAVEEYTWEINK